MSKTSTYQGTKRIDIHIVYVYITINVNTRLVLSLRYPEPKTIDTFLMT